MTDGVSALKQLGKMAPPKTDLSLAYVGCSKLASQLSLDADLRPLTQSSQAAIKPVDFSLIIPPTEAEITAEPQKAQEFQALCRALLQIPRQTRGAVVFWHYHDCSEQLHQALNLSAISAACDLLFSTQAKGYLALAQGNKAIAPLPFAIQPRHHHPYRPLLKGAAAQSQSAEAILVVSPPSDAKSHQTILQAAASGVLPVLIGSSSSETFVQSGTPDFKKQLDQSPIERRILAHRAWRDVFQNHSFSCRLETIARALGLSVDLALYPKVSVVIPTFRLSFVERCLENFAQQTYPEKELVLVLHTDEDISFIHEMIKNRLQSASDEIKVYALPKYKSVGSCINLGIDLSEGDYVLKMDDDDYYSPSYLMDMMLPLKAIDADVFGKPPFFFYSEADDKTYVRNEGLAMENTVATSQDLGLGRARITGASHSGKLSVLRSVRFSETALGAADTALYERCADHRLCVGIWDGFGTSACRAAQAGHHTWQASQSQLKRSATLIGDGLCASQVGA